jgi:chemotaxis protein MotB
MAKKKCQCEAGAPGWMTTFADMMTLLLCFFVLIVSFSEIKKDDKYQAVVEEIQEAFGMHGGGGKLPTDDDPALSLLQILETTQLQRERIEEQSRAEDPGVDGKTRDVTTVREGDLYVVGGRITFEPGSADLTPEARRQLMGIVPEIRGIRNLVQVRGHAAAREVATDGTPVGDLVGLSYARAKAVGNFLTSEAVGIDPARVRLMAVGPAEPLNNRSFTTAEQEPNRRVEVMLADALVKDFTQDH